MSDETTIIELYKGIGEVRCANNGRSNRKYHTWASVSYRKAGSQWIRNIQLENLYPGSRHSVEPLCASNARMGRALVKQHFS